MSVHGAGCVGREGLAIDRDRVVVGTVLGDHQDAVRDGLRSGDLIDRRIPCDGSTMDEWHGTPREKKDG